jgi:hypothetical protein
MNEELLTNATMPFSSIRSEAQRKKRTYTLAQQKKPNNRPDDNAQSKLFIEKARGIEADEEHSAADKLMGTLARKKPEPHKRKSESGQS